jgi:hypothetical protein
LFSLIFLDWNALFNDFPKNDHPILFKKTDSDQEFRKVKAKLLSVLSGSGIDANYQDAINDQQYPDPPMISLHPLF